MAPKKKGGGSAASTPRDEPKKTEPADGEPDEEIDDVEEQGAGNKRDGADISKVTDYVEQKELDSARASQAIASITAEMKVDREAELAREKELAAVKIDQVRLPATSSNPETPSPPYPPRSLTQFVCVFSFASLRRRTSI